MRRVPAGSTHTGWSRTPPTRASGGSSSATRSGPAPTRPASTTSSPRYTPDAVRPARSGSGRVERIFSGLVRAAAPATDAGHQEHAEGCQGDLDRVFDPVDAGGLRDTERSGNGRTEQGGHDTDHDRQPDRHVLPTGYDEPAERTDDGTDDDRPDDR